MRDKVFMIYACIIFSSSMYGQITTGGNTSSIMTINSTSKGILTPRMTKTDRNGISNPATGLLIYQTDSIPGFYFYAGAAWKNLGATTFLIQDADQDTKVQIEKNLNDNVIRFDVAGSEVMTASANDFGGSKIEFPNNSGNILIGSSAGKMTNGSNNIALGDSSLLNNTSGNNNTALGKKPLFLNTVGKDNLAIGTEALYSNVVDSNFAIGYKALRSTTTGKLNTAIGYQAMLNNTTGNSNTALGSEALKNNSVGAYNVSLGENSMFDNTSGSHNTAIGRYVMENNQIGDRNTVLSLPYQTNPDLSHTLSNNVDGSENTVAGLEAMQNPSSAYQTTAIGNYALKSLTTGVNNTGIGSYALRSVTIGESNVGIGHHALSSLTSGSRNTFLGKGLDFPSANYSLGSNMTLAHMSAIGKEFDNNNSTVVGYTCNISGINNTAIGKNVNITGGFSTENEHTVLGSVSYFPIIGNTIFLGNIYSRLGIGTTSPHPSAIIEISSTTKGILIPRVDDKELISINQNQDQRDMLVYDKSLKSFYRSNLFEAIRWQNINNMFDKLYAPENAGKIPVWDGTKWQWTATYKIEDIDGNSNMRLTDDHKFVIRLDGVDRFRIVKIFGNFQKFAIEPLTENNCLYFGNNAGLNAGLSSDNTAIGYNALKNVSNTGNRNTAFGSETLVNNTDGSDNTAVGKNALQANTLGNANTAIGINALSANTTGSYNTALGFAALNDLEYGDYNTAIGNDAEVIGDGINYGTAIGYKARVTQSHSLVLGSIEGVNNATTTAKVGITESNPQALLHIRRFDANGQPILTLKNNDLGYARIKFKSTPIAEDWAILGKGAEVNADARFDFNYAQNVFSLHGNGNAVLAGTLTQSSDKRLKRDIKKVSFDKTYLNDIQSYYYNWKDKEKSQQKQIGFIAQEIENRIPSLVTKAEGVRALNYYGMTPIILEGIKSFDKEISESNNEILEAQYQLKALQSTVNTLKTRLR